MQCNQEFKGHLLLGAHSGMASTSMMYGQAARVLEARSARSVDHGMLMNACLHPEPLLNPQKQVLQDSPEAMCFNSVLSQAIDR